MRTTCAPSCSSMSVTRSWVIGRGVVALWSFIRIAAASGWPIQIGRNLFPEAVFEHRPTRLLDRRLGGRRDGVGGHPLAHPGLARVDPIGDRPHDVALGQDPDHPAEV